MFGFRKKSPVDDESAGTAVFVDEVGSIKLRVFKMISKTADGKTIIDFGNNEKYTVRSRYIRRRRCLIYKTSKGTIVVQDPDRWKEIPLKDYDIKELRFNLQNAHMQESKAALNRWTLPPDKITQLAPLFKLMLVCVVIGVIGWFALKYGGQVLDKTMAARILDCNSVIPHLNVTNPIDATMSAPIH